MQCRDTFWVESFNHQLLTYLSKRIHYSTATYVLRMNLAVLDWISTFLSCSCVVNLLFHGNVVQNENVSRPTTSERTYYDHRRPDRHTPKRILVAKTFRFVRTVWSLYLQRNITDHRYMHNIIMILLKNQTFNLQRPLDDTETLETDHGDCDDEEDDDEILCDGEDVDEDVMSDEEN